MAVAVLASFAPKPGREAEVETILRNMIAPTRAEAGCRRYDLYRGAEGAPSFHLFEIYDDMKAIEAHRATPHYKAYRAAIADLLAEPVAVKILTALDVA